MTQENMKTTINNVQEAKKIFGIFHNDLDGYGCEEVAKNFLSLQDGESLHLNYNKISNEVDLFCKEGYKKYDAVIIADISLDLTSLNKLSKLANENYPVLYFDHHYKTNEQIEFLKNSNIVSILDNKICATSIMYNYFINNGFTCRENINLERLSEIVTMIDAWDTYKWRDPNSFKILNEDAKNLNVYFTNFGHVKTMAKIESYINDKFESLYSNIESANIKLLNRETNRAVLDRSNNLETMQFFFENEVLDIGVTYAEKDFSEIGNKLNVYNKNLSFIVIIDMIHKSVNFRTIFDKPNLAKVAALFGGGGHPKSAGCPLTEEAFNIFVNKTLSKEQISKLLNFASNKNKENVEA